MPAATVRIANAMACRWNAESPNCFLNPRIAAAIKISEEMAKTRSAISPIELAAMPFNFAAPKTRD